MSENVRILWSDSFSLVDKFYCLAIKKKQKNLLVLIPLISDPNVRTSNSRSLCAAQLVFQGIVYSFVVKTHPNNLKIRFILLSLMIYIFRNARIEQIVLLFHQKYFEGVPVKENEEWTICTMTDAIQESFSSLVTDCSIEQSNATLSLYLDFLDVLINMNPVIAECFFKKLFKQKNVSML